MITQLRSLTEASHAAAWIRQMDVRVKLALLLALALLVVLIDAASTLLVFLCVVALFTAGAGLSAGKLRMILLLSLLTVWGTMLTQALFYASVPRTVLVTLVPPEWGLLGRLTGGVHLYREGLAYGAVQSLRIVTMTAFGLLVCWTTSPGEFLSALVRLRVPYGVAFMSVTALRFLPAVVSELGVVLAARRMKGYTLRRRRFLRPWRGVAQVLLPVFANAIRRSRTLALSAESRGFDPSKKRTAARGARLGLGARAGLLAVLLTVAAVTGMKLLYWMFLEEVYYRSALRGLYDFVRTYL